MFRNKIFPTFALVISCSCSSSDKGNAIPEELGKSILNAFISDDKDLFAKYVYTAHEVDYFLEHYGKPLDSARQYQRYEEYYPKLIDRFQRIKDDAASKGLTNWENVQFSKVSYNPRSNGIEARSARLEFVNGDFIGTIKLSTINKSDRGWFMAGMPSFGGYSRMVGK